MTQLLTITDEKLEEYLSVWDRLVASDYRSKLDITLQMDYLWPWRSSRYTLTYGEERRELTYEQAVRAKQWLDSLQAVRA